MATFDEVWPGKIVALADAVRSRSSARGRRHGRLSDLEALAGRGRKADGPGAIEVSGDGWDGRR